MDISDCRLVPAEDMDYSGGYTGGPYVPPFHRPRGESLGVCDMNAIGIEDLSDLFQSLKSDDEDDFGGFELEYTKPARRHKRKVHSGNPQQMMLERSTSPGRVRTPHWGIVRTVPVASAGASKCGVGARGPLKSALYSRDLRPIAYSTYPNPTSTASAMAPVVSKKRPRNTFAPIAISNDPPRVVVPSAGAAPVLAANIAAAPAPTVAEQPQQVAATAPLSRAQAKQMRKNVRERERREEVNTSFEKLHSLLGLKSIGRARYDKVTVLTTAAKEIHALRHANAQQQQALAAAVQENESLRKRQRVAQPVAQPVAATWTAAPSHLPAVA